MRFTEEMTERAHYDVLVAGGGLAGVAAAVAAARAGKRVLLLEKSQKLGGLATLGLINLFVPMCNGRGKQIIFGMAEEFLRLSIRNGYISPLQKKHRFGPHPGGEARILPRGGQAPAAVHDALFAGDLRAGADGPLRRSRRGPAL